MRTQIELKEMKFYAYHGVMEQERTVGNHFTVDLLLTASLEEATRSDHLEDTMNYATVYDVVKKEMEVPSRLIEAVAGRILEALKSRFPQLTEVKLTLSKLNPPFGGDIRCASVILTEKFN